MAPTTSRNVLILARRFRDFINFGAYLDLRPNDDIVDILGFLSFEMVRQLCVTSLDVRDRHVKQAAASVSSARDRNKKSANSPTKRKLALGQAESPVKKAKVDGSPEPGTPTPSAAKAGSGGGAAQNSTSSQPQPHAPVSLFAPPPSARQPLLPAHVLEAFAQIQRETAAHRSAGMNNWGSSGYGRNRTALV